MALEHIWAPWRATYVTEAASRLAGGTEGPLSGEGSLFEQLLCLPDEESFVVRRGELCSVLLNAYPYTNGHTMVMPNRAVAELADLTSRERQELWQLVEQSVAALRAAFDCDGVNVGMNLGLAAGAGVPEHLHVHVLPRWAGDTNFMTSVAQTRVLPESLRSSWEKLRAAWP